ncbi:T9SS type A sorting domain-containing protein [Edaphocola flava]|uniref:T9SS type A sorting domain-containing protein n=1 Tax=Edaphocola flava TaxID=2499629 RepID=UPI00100B9008|nr:T9SS type A sorting domain-containing protein [Edaphocola flava]
MKKIFTSLALLGAFVTGANAQKNADLEINPYFPQPAATYANLNAGDTFYIAAIVTNNGPNAIVPTDTIVVGLNGCFTGASTGNSYTLSAEEHLTLASGASDTLIYPVIQGSAAGSTSTEQVIVKWNTNSLDTVVVSIYGFDQNGLFNDDGIDNTTGEFTTGSNNVIGYTITFGNPNSIKETQLAKEVISVYPNPAVNEVNFDYTFKAATEASVRVLDVTGRQVYTQSFGKQAAGKQSLKVDVSSLNNGMYTIELITDNAKAVSKFNIAK